MDGWITTESDTDHYSYNGKILCTGAPTPKDCLQDNRPPNHCKTCFESTRLLFNTDDEKVLFKESKSSD